MAGLLNTTPQYVNPQAQILYGAGNNKISDADIKAFISAPNRTADEIKGAALANNISVDQISSAMGSKDAFAPAQIDSYLSGQGITKELRPEEPKQNLMQIPPVAAQNATYTPAIQDPISGTVAGQLERNLNPESPLMKRAAAFGNQQANARGLLNSSIGISAAQNAMVDAGLQIATPDANSSNMFGITNADAQNKNSMFNSDLGSRVGMFNAGTQKDLNIAQLDTNNKLAIANIQAMANDAGIMGDQVKTMMSLYQQTMADTNIGIPVKEQITNTLMSWTKQMGGVLPSFAAAGIELSKAFSSKSGGAELPASGAAAGSAGSAGSGGATGTQPASTVGSGFNVLNYQVEPRTMASVVNYEKQTGQTIDKSRVAPEALVMDIKAAMNPGQYLGGYTTSDGTTRVPNFKAYDLNAMMQTTGAKNYGELFDKLFVAAHGPRSLRADNPMFYLYR